MATQFKRYTASGIGSDAVSVIPAVPAGTTVVIIGMSVVNKTAANVRITGTAAGARLFQGVVLPPDTTGFPLDGKLVLAAGDELTITSDAADSVDAIVSTMELS